MSEFPLPVGPDTQSWLCANGFNQVEEYQQIGGESHNRCYLLTGTNNEKLVAKIASSVSAREALPKDDNPSKSAFEKEAYGLNLIAKSQSIRTPEVVHVSENCLLLEYLSPAQQQTNYWSILANEMAQLHKSEATQSSRYGLDHNNYCGANIQVNGWFNDGHEFFADQRLLYQARMAFDNGLLESPWVIHIESICERLTDLIPTQPASLVHGDLWSGNILVDDTGNPALIDPAVYFGWREADIAMTLLFGGLPHEFYVSYDEIWPMEPQWRSRVHLYNLYHLLNHLNIFGVSYLEQVQGAIARYA